MTPQSDGRRFGFSSRQRAAAVIAAAFAVPLVVYVFTLAPTVVGGDTGELTTSAYLLGVPHPTGYPLYMLLVRGFQYLPVGSIAYRANLFSAVCMAAMCGALAWTYLGAGGARWGALLAALTAGFINVVWSQALVAEVYALNALLLVVIVGLFVRWRRTRSTRALVALAAVSGLALTHHRTALFFAAPCLAAALLLHRPAQGRLLVKAAVAFLAPLLLYLYLPLRAGKVPIANWGDPGTWHRFVDHAMGAQYAVFLAEPRPISPGVFLGRWLVGLPVEQITFAGLALAVVGWGVLLWSRRALWAVLTFGGALTAGLAARYSVSDAPVFLLPVYLALAGLLAAGTEAVARGLSAARRGRLGAVLLAGAAVALPARLAWANWSHQDLSQAWLSYDAGRIMFAEVEPHSLLLLSGDSLNGVAMYQHAVEHRGPSVSLVWAEHAGHPWYDRDLPLDGLAQEAQQARRAFLAGESAPDEKWGPFFTRRAALRYAALRPTYSNLTLTDLPPGYCLLEKQATDRILPGAPDLQAADGPDLPAQIESVSEQGAHRRLAQLALAGRPAAAPVGEGVVLLRAEPEPLAGLARHGQAASVAPGEVFRVRYQWRCAQAVEQRLILRVEFVNVDWLQAQGDMRAASPQGRHGWSAEHAFLYGVTPLEPNAAGRHYEQVGYYIAARAAAPGAYLMRAGVGPPGGLPVPVARIDLEAAP